MINRKQGQVVNVDGDEAQVMDLDSYTTFVMKLYGDQDMEADDTIEFLEFDEQRRIL